MQGIPWEHLTVGIAAIVMVGLVCLGMFRFVGNHLAHLTGALEKLGDAITCLREHCAATIAKRENDGGD